MNIAYFLLPKSRIAYLYDDFTFRQGLENLLLQLLVFFLVYPER